MDRFEEFIVKKYPNRSPKVLLQKLQDIDGTWFYAVKEVQDQSEVWQSRQAEVDEKDKLIEELESRLNAVNLLLVNWNDEYTQNTTSHESIADAVLRTCATELKQALRGECE